MITVPEDGWSEAPLSQTALPATGSVVEELPVDVAAGAPDNAGWDFDDPAANFLISIPSVEPSAAPELSGDHPRDGVDPFDEPSLPGTEGLDAARADYVERPPRLEHFPRLMPVDETLGASMGRVTGSAFGDTASAPGGGTGHRRELRALAGVAAAGCVLGLGLLSVGNGSGGEQRGPELRASALSAGDLVEDLETTGGRIKRVAAAAEERRRVRDRRERALRQRRAHARVLASRADRALPERRAQAPAAPVVSAPPAAAPVASAAPAPAGRGRQVSAAATEFLP